MRNKDWDHTELSNSEYAGKQGKVLHEREMITPEKREVLKALGLKQVYMYNTMYYGPDVNYDELDQIPTNRFCEKLQGGIEVIYDGYDRDRMIIFDKDQKYNNGQIDDGKPYNWETGLERLKQLLNGKRKEKGTEIS